MTYPFFFKKSNNFVKEFGITKQMLIDQASAMGMNEIVNAKGQITDMDGLNKALMQLMKDRYDGAMQIQSTSLNGMISNLQDWFSTTGRTLGEGVFEKVKEKLGVLLQALNDFSQSGKIDEWATRTANAITTFWNTSEVVINALISAGRFIYDNWNIISPVLAGVLAGFMAYKTITGVIQAVTLAQTALNAVMAMNPIGMVAIAIGALVAAGVLLYQNWDTVKAKASELWTGLKNIFSGIKTSILSVWDGITTGIKNQINKIISTVNRFIDGLNKIHFSFPGFGGVGGFSWGINISHIPMLAKGGNILDDGAFIAGENGAELISGVKGARVTPLDKLGNGITININDPVLMDDYTTDKMMDKVMERLSLAGVI